MQRRTFVEKLGIASVATLAAPLILPSGRSFAKNKSQKAKHVVLCILGGGVRNQESIHHAEGSLMSNLFEGGGRAAMPGLTVLPDLNQKKPIQTQGTLFKKFQYKKGPTGHFNAYQALLTGAYTESELDHKSHPELPTVFEYYRKHRSFITNKNDCVWISSKETPFTSLKNSQHRSYGELFSAHHDFSKPLHINPWNIEGGMSFDMQTAYHAENILNSHQPELLVVNFHDMDICHRNFTAYCDHLQKADYAISHLWNSIQNNSSLADETVMIIVPDHGRDKNHNSVEDEHGRYSYDHTGDESSREIFCLVLGPSHLVKQNQVIEDPCGESIEVLPAISSLLGFEEEIPKGLLQPFQECGLKSAFV